VTDQDRSIWGIRARSLVEQALCRMDDYDVIGTLDAAITCLRIEMRELSGSSMDEYPFPGEERDEDECTCPPGLRARGGFRSTCLACAAWPELAES
jgi:hypothetical protein